MKFMRWVMDVCPLRLLKGRMASWAVSTRGVSRAWALTDSAMESSSDCRNFLEPLFCFLLGWLFLGVGAFLKGRLPRCWPKKWTVAETDWFWAGDCGAAGAEALEEEAAGGGFEDMMLPARGVHDDGGPEPWALLSQHENERGTAGDKIGERLQARGGLWCTSGSPRGMDLESQSGVASSG